MQSKLGDGNIMIVGVLPNDAEYKTVGEKGSSLTKFGVKVAEKKDGGGNNVATWVNCECWHAVARATSTFKKGDVVLCVGYIKTNTYEGKEYRNLVCEFVVKMPNVDSVEGGEEALSLDKTKKSSKKKETTEGGFEISTDDDDLPF